MILVNEKEFNDQIDADEDTWGSFGETCGHLHDPEPTNVVVDGDEWFANCYVCGVDLSGDVADGVPGGDVTGSVMQRCAGNYERLLVG